MHARKVNLDLPLPFIFFLGKCLAATRACARLLLDEFQLKSATHRRSSTRVWFRESSTHDNIRANVSRSALVSLEDTYVYAEVHVEQRQARPYGR